MASVRVRKIAPMPAVVAYSNKNGYSTGQLMSGHVDILFSDGGAPIWDGIGLRTKASWMLAGAGELSLLGICAEAAIGSQWLEPARQRSSRYPGSSISRGGDDYNPS